MTIETKKEVTIICTCCGNPITKTGLSVTSNGGNRFQMIQLSEDKSFVQYFDTPCNYSMYGGEFCNFSCYVKYIEFMNKGAE